MKTLSVVGDKSISHRMLILAALHPGQYFLKNLSIGEDVKSTIHILRQLGGEIDEQEGRVHVSSTGQLRPPLKVLDCGNSGTTMRLMMGVLAVQNFESYLTGDESLLKRPMDRVAHPLNQMGAKIQLLNKNFGPVTIQPGNFQGGEYELPVASSQVKSALMLAGHISGKIVSLTGRTDSRDHTERLLPMFIAPGNFKGLDENFSYGENFEYKIPGDPSAAAYYVTTGLLNNVQVLLEDCSLNPTRLGFIRTLRDMGVEIELKISTEWPEPRGNLTIHPQRKQYFGFRILPQMVPYVIDEIPLLALIATQCQGTTVIQGLEELKYKESNRLNKIYQILKGIGADIEVAADSLRIHGPTQLRGAVVGTENDHRLTMMVAVAQTICQGIIDFSDRESVLISDPNFYRNLKELLE